LTAPWTTPFGTSRYNGLPDGGTPNAHFDYVDASVGGFSSGSMYSYYVPDVDSNLNDPSPVSMLSSYAITGTDVSVSVDILVDQTVTTSNNYVYFVVIEDDVHSHDNIARMVLADEPFLLTTPGESTTVNRVFTLDPSWKQDDIEVVVFVQTMSGTKKVLQATKAQANYVGSVAIDIQPVGLSAGWTMTGPNGYNVVGVDGQLMAVFDEGDYTLTFDDVDGWTTPAPGFVTQTMVMEGELTFTGTYTGAPFTAVTTGDLGHTGAGRGVALVDVDHDDDLDIHVTNNGEADLLLRNDGAGVFTNIATGPTADAGAGQSAVWADYDNDGDLDYYQSKDNEANVLVRNDAGTFVAANMGTIGNAGPGRGVAWADFNGDDLLDVYLCNDGAANILFKGYGPIGPDWFFLEQSSGVNDAASSQAVCWADYDDDGDQDLLFTNSGAADRLFENAGDFGFYEVSNGTINNIGLGMGADWGDFNLDGNLDMYLCAYGSSDRMVRQTATAWVPQGGTPASNVGNTRSGIWGDFDNDGDLDVFQSKGGGEFDRILRNDGPGVFSEIPLGLSVTGGDAYGAAWGDLDGDGDLDLYIVNDGSANALLINDQTTGNHWLHVRLTDDSGNISPIGATVRVTTAGLTQRREIRAGNGYLSQSSLDAEFGLGANTSVTTLEIIWPDGEVQTISNPPIDGVYSVVQGQTTGIEDETVETPTVFSLHRAYPNPFNPSTSLVFDLPRPENVDLRVYDLAGRLIRTLVSNEHKALGRHSIIWDGTDNSGRVQPAGVYVVKLNAGEHSAGQRVMLVK
jgi:hypothetical protein